MDRQPAEAETQGESAGAPSLLRHRPGFPALMVSIAFGAIASGILNVANDLVAIYALGADATQIGLLNASESVAFLFLAIPAGILLDRVNRIKTMIWAQAAAGLAIMSVPICWALQVLSYPQLLVVSFLVGVAGMFWGMGAGSALPGIVGRDLISAAFARKETVDASVGIISPGLAGILVALVSAPFTLLVAGAANFMAAGALLWGFRNKSNIVLQPTEPKERNFVQGFLRRGAAFHPQAPDDPCAHGLVVHHQHGSGIRCGVGDPVLRQGVGVHPAGHRAGHFNHRRWRPARFARRSGAGEPIGRAKGSCAFGILPTLGGRSRSPGGQRTRRFPAIDQWPIRCSTTR